MKKLVDKYAAKLETHRLCETGNPLVGGLDAEITWNRTAPESAVLEEVVAGLSIASILYARPAGHYGAIMDRLAEGVSAITPEDSETRTFLHEIPVCRDFAPGPIIAHLKRRKSVIIPGRGIVTTGSVSPEQAFVTFSSVCFSLYVKFFADYWYALRRGPSPDAVTRDLAAAGLGAYRAAIEGFEARPALAGPFDDPVLVLRAMAEAGRLTVRSGMVDSFFGNISCRRGDTIYISQTGSSLDELEGAIDPCPLDGSSTAAVTASSELSAHRSVYERSPAGTILHGHPRFSVIASMLCEDESCANRGACYKKCTRGRFVAGVPIVPGEVGTGPTGISTTLPPALTGRGAIVWGHGLFTTGRIDFTDAFAHLIDIERACLDAYAEQTSLV